jgi:DNA-binding winged helix-turn-helix (wHTH) protein
MALPANELIRFDEYQIDTRRWTLQWRDEPLALKRKSFDLLLFLVNNRDRVVSKEELMQALWPGQFVEEGNLTQHVFLVRKALSRHPSGLKIIETISGRGYRFMAPVEIDQDSLDVQRVPAPEQAQQIVVNTTTSITQITIEEEEIEEDGDEAAVLRPHAQRTIPGHGSQARLLAAGAASDGRSFGRRRFWWVLAGAADCDVCADHDRRTRQIHWRHGREQNLLHAIGDERDRGGFGFRRNGGAAASADPGAVERGCFAGWVHAADRFAGRRPGTGGLALDFSPGGRSGSPACKRGDLLGVVS